MKPLDEYARRRDLRASPEPRGQAGRARKSGLVFVVQEHHASHLHYDFRLELDGVLKSWAVSKGPSLDPGQKRLAVQVEDHPLEYANFSGVIPPGNYGAGQVFIWDRGTWSPKGDARRGLSKGRLEFNLYGGKLKGAWLLVRTRSATADRPQWLLFKHRDGQARAVKARAERTPQFTPPQLARLVERPPAGLDWIHEIKFDGYRIQAHLDSGKVKLFTRGGHDWTAKHPELSRALARLKARSAVIDGEVVWQDASGRSDFQGLQRAMRRGRVADLVFWAFDLLHLNGKDLASLPLIARKDRLERLLKSGKSPLLRFSGHFRDSGPALLKAACEMGLEGVVSKRADRPYAPGRREWTKSKCVQRQEFVIGGYTEGTRSGFGALLLGVYEGARLHFVGRVGTGFDQKLLVEISRRLRRLERRKSRFSGGRPAGRGCRWVAPRLVCEVAFREWTGDGHLRAPVFLGLHADKDPAGVGPEMKEKGRPRVTHPDRVLYKSEGITKQQVAEYYEAVSEWIAPHIHHRPLALLRCTGDSTHSCFFSKHFAARLPPDIVPVPEKGKRPYVTIASADGLATLIQFGTLEIHPWNCHAADLEAPDQIVMDFDPDPRVAFSTVKDGALELRELLCGLGIECFVKVTGGKGLHVQFPFVPAYDWNAVKSFAKSLSLEMVARHPHLYTANIAKRARAGKIFLDYLRNGRGATAIAPYALRARARSSVAMPITWSQLKNLRAADQFSLTSALEHLQSRRKDPWSGYADLRQRITLLDQPAA